MKNTPNHRGDPLKNSKKFLFQKSKTRMELCMEIHFSLILCSESYQIEKIDIWAQWINFLAFMALWLKLTSLYGLYSGEKFVIGFLAELGNFKHFEPHLFFGKFWPFLALRPLWPSKAKKFFLVIELGKLHPVSK